MSQRFQRFPVAAGKQATSDHPAKLCEADWTHVGHLIELKHCLRHGSSWDCNPGRHSELGKPRITTQL